MLDTVFIGKIFFNLCEIYLILLGTVLIFNNTKNNRRPVLIQNDYNLNRFHPFYVIKKDTLL